MHSPPAKPGRCCISLVKLEFARRELALDRETFAQSYANSRAAHFKKQLGRLTVVDFGQVAWESCVHKARSMVLERHTF
jgi:hypothetical protein